MIDLLHTLYSKPIYSRILSLLQTFSTGITIGSHVWVEDPDVAWVDGEVVEVNGEDVKVNCTSGKLVSIFFCSFMNFKI